MVSCNHHPLFTSNLEIGDFNFIGFMEQDTKNIILIISTRDLNKHKIQYNP